MKQGLCALILAVLIFAPRIAAAACDPKDDPCAPKKVVDAWTKSLAVGFNYTNGNSATSALSILAGAARETSQDISDISAAYGYGDDKAREDSGLDSKNKDDFRAAGNYRYLLSDRLFAAAGATFLYDSIADIDYRTSLVPSLGYYLVKNPDVKFALDAGPGYTFERVGGIDNDYLSPKIGERLDWTISCTAKLYEQASVLLDTTDSENYVVNSEAGIEAAIATSFSIVLLVRDTLDNVPAEGKEKNDIAVITALKVSL